MLKVYFVSFNMLIINKIYVYVYILYILFGYILCMLFGYVIIYIIVELLF